MVFLSQIGDLLRRSRQPMDGSSVWARRVAKGIGIKFCQTYSNLPGVPAKWHVEVALQNEVSARGYRHAMVLVSYGQEVQMVIMRLRFDGECWVAPAIHSLTPLWNLVVLASIRYEAKFREGQPVEIGIVCAMSALPVDPFGDPVVEFNAT